ncbi:MAG: phospholipid carrier-dependent glycosyltransferase [Armatimonadetes bacterium]|nr:phospholipid carrier-dependent glycosyltransferase [Armatimonadota bacterium]
MANRDFTNRNTASRYLPTAGILLLAVCTYFWGLGAYGLLDPDEGRYAEIPREMLETGDFITPHLNYVKYFEKPPLFYWLVAAAMAGLGQTEFAARLVCALSGLLTLLCVVWLGRRMFGSRVGSLAGWVYLTSLLPLIMSRYLIIDGLLTFCITASWASWWASYATTSQRHRQWWMVAAWLFLALAVLAKGPVAIVLSGLLIALFAIARRDASLLWRTFTLPGVLVFFAVAGPWFVLVSLRNPEFLHFFVIVQHLERFAGREHAKPFWFFFPICVMGMGGWGPLLLAALPPAIRRAFVERAGTHALRPAGASPQDSLPQGGAVVGAEARGQGVLRPSAFAGMGGAAASRAAESAPLAFILLWIVAVVGFFSASKCKLAPYVLPAFPALSLLVGWFLAELTDGLPARWARAAAGIAGIVLFLLSGALPRLAALQDVVPLAELEKVTLMLQVVAGVAGLAMIVSAVEPRFLAVSGGLAVLLFTPAAVPATATVAKYKRVPVLLKAMPPLPDEVSVAEWRTYEQSLGFYTQRRIILVDYLGELAFGSTIGDQSAFFLSGLDSLRRLSQRGPLLIVTDPRDWPEVRRLGIFKVVAANTSNVLAANDPLIRLMRFLPYPDGLPRGPCLLLPRVQGGATAGRVPGHSRGLGGK